MRLFNKLCGSLILVGGILLSTQTQVFASNVQSYPVMPNFDNIQELKLDSFNTSDINSDEDAYYFLKHRVLNRRPIIQLNLSKELSDSVKKRFANADDVAYEYICSILDKIEQHTGVIAEGDYIRQSNNHMAVRAFEENGCMTIRVYINFFTTTDKEKMVDEKIKELLSETGELGYINHDNVGDFEKVKAIFSWVVTNVKYDHGEGKRHSAYGGLIEGRTVCEGISAIFYRLCTEVGVDCRIIIGLEGGIQHAWNIVKIGSIYYNVDATFSLGAKDDDYATFFLLEDLPDGFFYSGGDRVLGKAFNNDEFKKKYPMSLKRYNFIMTDVRDEKNRNQLKYTKDKEYVESRVTPRNSGKAGENVRWSYDYGVLTIDGVGAMYDYAKKEEVPWYSYGKDINKIVIENKVTYIGNNAFACTNLSKNSENVTIAPSVMEIGEQAFLNEDRAKIGNMPSMSELYEPVLKEYCALDKHDPVPVAETMVVNKSTDSYIGIKLPKGTEVSWTSTIDTETPSRQSANLLIQYPDGSTDQCTIGAIFIRELVYSDPPVKLKVVSEPNKTRYVAGKETFDSSGIILGLVDQAGNQRLITEEEFEENNIKFYTNSWENVEITKDTIINEKNTNVWLKYQDLYIRIILVAEPDGNYELPQPQNREWEQNQPLLDPSIFIKNKENLPNNTIYKFVTGMGQETEITISTVAQGVQTLYICVEYPNATKEWIRAEVNIVETVYPDLTKEKYVASIFIDNLKYLTYVEKVELKQKIENAKYADDIMEQKRIGELKNVKKALDNELLNSEIVKETIRYINSDVEKQEAYDAILLRAKELMNSTIATAQNFNDVRKELKMAEEALNGIEKPEPDESQENIGTNQGTGSQGNTGTNQGTGNQGNTGTNQGTGNQGNTGTNQGTGNQGNTGTNQGTGNQGNTGTNQGTGNQGNTGTNQGTGNQGNTGTNQGTGSQGNTAISQGTGSQESTGNNKGGLGSVGGFGVPVVAIPNNQDALKESSGKTEEIENTKKEEIKQEETKEITNSLEKSEKYLPSKQEKEDVKKAKVTVQSSILYINPNNKNKKKITTVKVSIKKGYKVTYSTKTKKIVSINKKTGKVIAKKSGTAIIKVKVYNQNGKYVGLKTVKLKVKK